MEEMTSMERIRAVIQGNVPDFLPIVPQNFMFAIKDGGYNLGEVNRKPAIMAQCHLDCREKYGYDGCVIDVDDSTLAEACGAKVEFREDSVAVVKENEPLLKDLREIDDLKIPDPMSDGRLPEWLETTSRVAEKLNGQAMLMGRADQGPFSLLCLLRGTQEFLIDLFEEDEEVIHHALEWTTKVHIAFAKAQLKAGAMITSMGDAYASPNLISPDLYRKFALPYEKKAAEAIRKEGGLYSVHICGNTTKIIQDMSTIHADVLEVDSLLNLEEAKKNISEKIILMGNIDPNGILYLGNSQQIEDAVKDSIEKTRGKGHIISSGCAVGGNTSPDNMRAFIKAARTYGSRENVLRLQEKK